MAIDAISQHLQLAIVKLAITDEEFLRLARPVLLPELFSSEYAALCIVAAVAYYDKHHKAAKDHFHDEVVRLSARHKPDQRRYLADFIERVQNTHPADRDYALSRITAWTRQRRLEGALVEASGEVGNNYSRAAQILYDALSTGVEACDGGYDYLRDFSHIGSRGDRPDVLMGTGIRHLDKLLGGGFTRGQFVTVLGPYKGCKSWCLQHFGKVALKRGLNILHISHENSEISTEQRYDMTLGSLVDGLPGIHKRPTDKDNPAAPWEVKVRILKGGKVREKWRTRPSLYDSAAVLQTRKAYRRRGGRLIIRKYPQNTGTMDEIRRLVHWLEYEKGFLPDVLINDYPDIMNLSSTGQKETRHQINDLYQQHKQLADENNILVLTASQIVTAALEAKRIRRAHASEDRRKIGNVDLALGISRSTADERQQRAWLWVVANRSGSGGGGCLIGTGLSIGQFALWSQSLRDAAEQEADGQETMPKD